MINKTVKRVIVGSINVIKEIQGKLDIKFYKSNYFEYWLRLSMPYGIIENGVVVNRFYKPLGIGKGEWVDYKDYSYSILDEGFISDQKYFYDDGTAPYSNSQNFKAYMTKINSFLSEL
ncbi:hypothetical protein [Dapis sp. BLCC M229]|uniref:hypothetical protein n=1 Tax=Dapis sp. BLCC M229 TaxID=3400188 RepID=UPI003CE72A05